LTVVLSSFNCKINHTFTNGHLTAGKYLLILSINLPFKDCGNIMINNNNSVTKRGREDK
jgi:hypothetical protein